MNGFRLDHFAATHCALCGYGFPTIAGILHYFEDAQQRRYCCVEHARFGLERLHLFLEQDDVTEN